MMTSLFENRTYKNNFILDNERKVLNKKLYKVEKEILVLECSDRMLDFKKKQLKSLRKIQSEIQIKLKQIELDLKASG